MRLKIAIFLEKVYTPWGEQIVYRLDDITRIPDIRPVVRIEHKRIERVEDLSPYNDKFEIRKNWERFDYCISHGAVMYIYVIDGTIVGRNMVSNLSVFKPHQFCKHPIFGTNNYMLFWTAVLPEYRNLKIGAYMTTVRSHEVLEKGGVLFTTTDTSNVQSYRMLLRTGFVAIGRLNYKELIGVRLRSEFIPGNPVPGVEKPPAILNPPAR